MILMAILRNVLNRLQKVEDRKDLYNEKSRDEIREYFYENGVDVTYKRNAETEQLKKKQFIMKCFFVQVPKLNLDKLFS